MIPLNATVPWFSRELLFPNEEVFDWGDIEIGIESVSERWSGRQISIAVLDSGIDRFHPDLSIQNGINFVGDRTLSDFSDDYGHGTFVAGILACLKNHRGLIGVCPNIHLLAARIGRFNKETRSYDNDVVSALENGVHWAVDKGADIINLSIEFQSISLVDINRLEAVFQRAINNGVILVAATGNDKKNNVAYPASSKLVLGVGAFGMKSDRMVDVRSWDKGRKYYVPIFSNYGQGLDVLAPGVRIPSTLPMVAGSYAWADGTSLAAPYVSGVCALILEADRVGRRRSMSYVNKIYKAIKDSARPLTGVANIFQSSGMIDAIAAIRAIGVI